MIRILQIVNGMNRAGLETMLMNYYQRVDKTKLQFDFLTHRPGRGDYEEQIEAMGGKIYRAPRLYPWNYPAYFGYMGDFFRAHPEYTLVHSHIDAMSYLPLLAAKRAGVPVRIAHSHNTSIDLDVKYPLKQYFRHRLPSVATHFFACGQEAGEYLFGDRPVQVISNGIETAKFHYDAETRRSVRHQMGLEGKCVVGHVGRLSRQKNQTFLMRIFAAIAQRRDAVMLLAGTGEQEANLRRLAKKLGIEDRVFFLGNRADVQHLYQAMDVFVLPSRFEGVPLVGIEAQTAGLPCFFSDRVPREVAFTENCAFLPLTESPEYWAEAILAVSGDRCPVVNNPYDIGSVSCRLEDIYQALWKEGEVCVRR